MNTDKLGKVLETQITGRGPAIWLAGDPEELKPWMDYGITGIVTNTVVLNEMVKKYGQLTELIKRYLDITDKPVVVEVDGYSTEELIKAAAVFTEMSPRIIIKIGNYSTSCHSQIGKLFSQRLSCINKLCNTIFTLIQQNIRIGR